VVVRTDERMIRKKRKRKNSKGEKEREEVM
jgi:hypothetical protein